MKDLDFAIVVRGKKKGTKSDNRLYPIKMKSKADLVVHNLEGENILLKYGIDIRILNLASRPQSGKINYFNNKTREQLQAE